ncbi:unnamed protein product [Sphagnum tenellum]
MEGPWTVLQGFSEDLNGSIVDSTRMGANRDTGLGLSLSKEDDIPPGHLQPSTDSSAFLGMRGGHAVSSPDSLVGRVPIQGSSKGEFIPGTGEFFPCNVGGKETENGATQVTESGLPTLGNRQARASANSIYSGERHGMNERRVEDGGRSRTFGPRFMEGRRFQDLGRSTDGRRVEHASGSMASDSLYMEQQVLRTAEPQLFGSSSNHTGRMDDCLPEASGNQELLNTTGACSSEGHHHSGADRTSLRHSISGSVLENATHSVFGNTRGSSRSSACKRKSCTSVVAGSLSCGTGSLRTGFRDSNGGRTVGGNGMSRRTIGISGCTSASDVVASTSSSAAASARSSELPIVASGLEETVTHRAASLRETLDLMPETHRGSRLGKSVRTISSESLVDANEESSSSSLLVPDETPGSSSTFCHSGSPSRLTGRSGMPSSPRHRDNGVGLFSLGEQLSHRYMGSSTHSFTSSLSSASQLGATVGTDSRLHNHAINFSNLEAMSPGAPVLADSVPPTMQTSSTRVSSPSPSRPPHPSRGRIQGNSVPTLLTNPAMSGPAPSRLSPSPPSSPSLVAPFADSHSSPTIHFQRSLLPRASASRFHERGFSLAADGLLGMPSHSLQVSAGDGTHPPRLMTEGLAEVKCVERDEDLTYEQLLMLEATLLFEGMGLHDHHRELRLDVDNMSYEELLALEDRIGNVSTGLTAEAVADKLKMSYYSSLNMAVARFSQEYDIKCSICQEEYEDGDELGKVDCGHSYHVLCIQQWLVQKNQCPICKAPAFA